MMNKFYITAIIILLHSLFTSYAFGLSNEQQADMYLLEAQKAYKSKDYAAAIRAFSSIERLNIRMDDEFYYFYAAALKNDQRYEKSKEKVNDYLNRSGTSGSYYSEALSLLMDVNKEIENEALANKKRQQEIYERDMRLKREAAEKIARQKRIEKEKEEKIEQQLRDEITDARWGDIDAMKRLAHRYRYNKGKTQEETASYWDAKIIAAQKKENNEVRKDKMRQLEYQSYFPGLKKSFSQVKDVISSRNGHGPSINFTGLFVLPIFPITGTTEDFILSKSTKATERIRKLKREIGLRPSTWAKPDSLIAKVSINRFNK